MKLTYKLFLILSSIALFSCMEEAFVEGPTAAQGLTAEIPSYQFDNQTRVNISQNLSTFTWSNGDKIGIYFKNNSYKAQGGFTVVSGGSNSGAFRNDAFSLKPNSTYYAFYPYNPKATVDSYPVDFTGQEQTQNGGTDHIGARNYMSAAVNTDASGAANIAFQNEASVIQLALPIEDGGSYTGVTLSSTAVNFTNTGTLDMKTGVITPIEKSQQIKLALGNGLVLNGGDILVANFLVAPVNLIGNTLSVVLESDKMNYLFEDIEGMNIQKGKAYKIECESKKLPYLTFTAEANQTLTMSNAVETLEYSVNNGEWQALGTNTVEFGGSNGELRLRGKSSTGTAKGLSSSSYSKIQFGCDVPVASSGDIRTLVDYENYQIANTKYARFSYLFEGCNNLTSAPELPATNLRYSCYYHMFEGCTSLSAAPELPATTLTDDCYNNMFKGCSSLTNAPELPAKILASSCYNSMFEGCTSLINAPELPATTITSFCYYNMFKGCSSLTIAPKLLPAATLASVCYQSMFEGCTSLTAAPELPAKILASSCYYSMFEGCTSLINAPELPATTLASNCYYKMFKGCSSLTTAPKLLPAATLASICYQSMFEGCTSLTNAPELPATTLTAGCYYNMFKGCSSLTIAPKLLPATTLADNCYYNMFNGCSSLTAAPELPATTLTSFCYYSMFSGCTSLTTAPDLPATTLADVCYYSMFSRCTSLTAAPKRLPATTLTSFCYQNMFDGCTSLTTAPELPATTLADHCYDCMFNNCSNLTTAPELPATTLTDYCYQLMFGSCSKLNYIKMMAIDISASNCLGFWTSSVSSTGTFVKNANATWDVRGTSGIPNRWTVEYATE